MLRQSRRLLDGHAEALMVQKVAYQALLIAKKALFVRMKQFRACMVGFWQETEWLTALPVLPALRAGREEFLSPMQNVAHLWPKVAAQPTAVPFAAPVMPDGYAAADFAQDLARVVELWDAVEVCAMDVKIARARLVLYYRQVTAAMQAYGHSARGRLVPGDPLVRRIPRTWGKR